MLKYHPGNVLRICTRQRVFSALAALFLCSCGAPSNDDYARMAQAGDAYTGAMDKLLVSTRDLRIDATSEKILVNDTHSEQYIEDSKKDDDLIEVIGDLRAQNKFFGRYFNLLNELATSDAPSTASQAASGIGSNLESINTKIVGSKVASPNLPDLLGSITKLAVNLKIRDALRNELDARQVTIRKALRIQSELLKQLAIDAQTSLVEIKQLRSNRQVIRPLVEKTIASTGDANNWVENRANIVKTRVSPQELDQASKASEELNQAFEDLLSDKLTIARIKNLLADIDSLLRIAESLKS